MPRVLVLLALTAGLVAPASAQTTVTRDAPWRLTGVSKDQETLSLVYEGGGCLRDDGHADVEATKDAIQITVKQTAVTGVPCTQEYAFLPLEVELDGPLDGRRVKGGPRMTAQFRPETMPRVVGLPRADAVTALAGQGIEARVLGRGSGVIAAQDPAPGARVPEGGVVLKTQLHARLAIAIREGQTIESVLRRGLRFRFRLDPDTEKVLVSRLSCGGKAAGGFVRRSPVAHAAASVRVDGRRLRRGLRRSEHVRCRLLAASTPDDPNGRLGELAVRRASVVLRHR